MNRKTKKTSANSAYRKMVRDHQDSRRFTVAGVVFGVLFLLVILFGGSSQVEQEPATSADTVASPDAAEIVSDYANGTPTIEEVDAIVNGNSGR